MQHIRRGEKVWWASAPPPRCWACRILGDGWCVGMVAARQVHSMGCWDGTARLGLVTAEDQGADSSHPSTWIHPMCRLPCAAGLRWLITPAHRLCTWPCRLCSLLGEWFRRACASPTACALAGPAKSPSCACCVARCNVVQSGLFHIHPLQDTTARSEPVNGHTTHAHTCLFT